MGIKASAQYTITEINEEYSVVISNESHVFRADKDNTAVAASTSIQIYGYQGSTQIATKVGTISGLPSAGMTATPNNNNSTNTSITITVTTALTSSVANNGTLTIPITVGTKTINKVFSWSKAQTGATGSSGTSAYVHIRYSDDNLKFTGNDGQDLGAFMGVCSTNSSIAPTTFNSYKWSRLSDYAGLNKWKVDVYTKTTVSGNSSVPTMENLLANETFKTSFLIEDSQSTTWGYGDNFLAVITTYAYFTEAYTMNTTAKSDDASSIYLNDTKIYDLVSCQATSVTINFVKGWNKIQFLMNEQAGEEYAYFSQKISKLEKVKFMSAYEEDKTKVGEQGLKGDTGATGGTGKSIGSITNYYLATSASSNVTTSTSGWTTTIQTVTSSKKYLWNYVVTKYTDNTVASTTTPCIIGVYGDKGDKGANGADGIAGNNSYSYIAYSNSVDGSKDFSRTDSAGKTYLGTLTINESESKNLLLESKTMAGWSMSSPFTKTTVNGFVEAAISRTGLTETTIASIYPKNVIPKSLIEDKIIVFSFELKVDNYSAWNNKKFMIWEAYSANNGANRVGWSDINITDNRLSYDKTKLENAEWTKMVFKVKVNRASFSGWTANTTWDNCTHIGTRLTLFQNGSLHFRKAKLEINNEATSWTAAPEDLANNYKNYSWSLVKGANGTSITISKTETVYQVGSSATSKPTGTWTTTIPATNGKNKYLWTRVTITYSDGHKTEAYSVSSTMDSITIGGNNLIFKGRGDKKEGFFTNFTMDSTTGELGLQYTSKGNYTGTNLNPGFLVKPRDYEVGSQLTWSYEIKYTKWNVPNNSNIRELWMGQRYTSPPSGETGTGSWRSITSTNLPKVDNKTYQLNKWYRIIQTITIPEAASDNVGTQGTLSFYYLNSTDKTESATIAFQLRNVKLEYGNIATDWTPSESETMSRDEINSSVNSAISGAKTYTDTEINKSAEKITSNIQAVSGKLELETTARQVENEKNGKKIRDLQLYTSQLKMSGNELSLNIDKTKGVNLLKNSVMKQYKERGGTSANSKTIKANFWLNKELKEDYFSTITYGEDGVSRSNTDSGSFFRFNFSGDNATKLDYIFSDPIDFKKNASNIILSYKLRKTQTLSNGIFFIGLVFYKTDASSTGMGSVINSTNGIPTGYYVPLAEYTDGVLNGSFTSDFIYKTLPITRHGDTDVQEILEVKQETVNGVIQKYIELSYTPSAAKSTVTITTFDDKSMAYTGTSKKIIITDTSIETDSVVTVSYTRSLNNFIAMTNPTSAKIVAELNKAPVTDVNIYYNSSNKKIWAYNPFTGVFKESNNLFDEKVADTNIDSVRVIIGARSTNDKTLLGQIDISDLKLEYNSVSTIWTQNVGETYSKQYKMDEKGFSISSDTNTMFIDEDEIAAYKVDNNTGELDTSNPVFQIKEDETILRQTTIYNQLNIENTTETREDAFVMKQENVNGKWFYIFY